MAGVTAPRQNVPVDMAAAAPMAAHHRIAMPRSKRRRLPQMLLWVALMFFFGIETTCQGREVLFAGRRDNADCTLSGTIGGFVARLSTQNPQWVATRGAVRTVALANNVYLGLSPSSRTGVEDAESKPTGAKTDAFEESWRACCLPRCGVPLCVVVGFALLVFAQCLCACVHKLFGFLCTQCDIGFFPCPTFWVWCTQAKPFGTWCQTSR